MCIIWGPALRVNEQETLPSQHQNLLALCGWMGFLETCLPTDTLFCTWNSTKQTTDISKWLASFKIFHAIRFFIKANYFLHSKIWWKYKVPDCSKISWDIIPVYKFNKNKSIKSSKAIKSRNVIFNTYPRWTLLTNSTLGQLSFKHLDFQQWFIFKLFSWI